MVSASAISSRVAVVRVGLMDPGTGSAGSTGSCEPLSSPVWKDPSPGLGSSMTMALVSSSRWPSRKLLKER